MCFIRHKIKVESIEQKITEVINDKLSELEQPIRIDFNKKKNDFSFCGHSYLCDYEPQNFSFAKEQYQKAIDLLKKELLFIKDKFNNYGIDNKIIVTKIKDLFEFEKSFQTRISEEHKKIIENKIEGILFTTVQLFQSLSREYMNFVINTKEQLLKFIKSNFVDIDLVNQFSKTLKEQDKVLPKELIGYKYNLNGYSIIYNLENFLRIIILIVLKKVPTRNMVDEKLYEKINDNKRKELSNKWSDERYGGDLFYLDFLDLLSIIKYNKTKFEKEKILIEKISSEFEKISVVRNKLAHNNIITLDDLEILKTDSKIIYRYFKNYKDEVLSYKFNVKNKK